MTAEMLCPELMQAYFQVTYSAGVSVSTFPVARIIAYCTVKKVHECKQLDRRRVTAGS